MEGEEPGARVGGGAGRKVEKKVSRAPQLLWPRRAEPCLAGVENWGVEEFLGPITSP